MQLDLLDSLAAKDRGMKLTASANSAWIAERLEDLRGWLLNESADFGRHEFRIEHFRLWCQINYRPEPSSHHAFGALTHAAVKEGTIEWTGRYALARSKKTHAHPVKIWRAKGA
jgi:hypothetical protein